MANKNGGGIIKGMAVGAALAAVVTMAVTNKKNVTKKAKRVMENTTENISSLFKNS